ncbi:MAG: hypothetical protein V1799_20670 [bacterium]
MKLQKEISSVRSSAQVALALIILLLLIEPPITILAWLLMASVIFLLLSLAVASYKLNQKLTLNDEGIEKE